MTSICENLVGKLLLWHSTTDDNAEAICREGFRPARKSGKNRIRQGTWFYHVTTFAETDDDRTVGFIVGVDLDRYVRGRDYAHEMANTVIFKIPLPPDRLLAKLSWTDITGAEALVWALCSQWECDLLTELVECCCDKKIPWSQKNSVAEMLWSLAADRYFAASIPCHMLLAEIPELHASEAAELVLLLREKAPRYLDGLLRLYHQTFLTPRFGRATMVAAARFMQPTQLLALSACSPQQAVSEPENAAVAKFVGEVLPRLPPRELVRGAIEMASMRRFPGNADDITAIGDWVSARANEEAEEIAFQYIMFSGDSFPARYTPKVARNLAIRILQATGRDHFSRLLALTETDDLDTLAGVTHAFAALGDRRAVPFLAARLKDDRKMPRAETVSALGRIGSPDALAAINTVARDKRKIVRNAVQRALQTE